MPSPLNEVVRNYWEQEPCGTRPMITGELPSQTREWFERIETHRYEVEPFIHSVAQFTRWHGKKLLEIGVGAGTDHLQWARAGAECYGIDLTEAAIETTKARLALYGFTSHLQRSDAEALPFPNEFFDVVYSWGVIHHSEHPERIIGEIQRVLKPGGVFIGMMYGRHSSTAFKVWLRYALLQGKPWRSLADVIWNHVESIGTKAYTVPELQKLFAEFSSLTTKPIITPYDTSKWPSWLSQYFPNSWGWFITLKAVK
ncbi:MAG TPA: class I SAM-dependent methyltransferase [Coleofasciculaceae cyanobacterium]